MFPAITILPCRFSCTLGPIDAQNLDNHPGVWRYRLTGDTSGEWGEFTVLAAEDCFLVMFVPKPGSTLLLGSALAGLAGYATLRWRTRDEKTTTT